MRPRHNLEDLYRVIANISRLARYHLEHPDDKRISRDLEGTLNQVEEEVLRFSQYFAPKVYHSGPYGLSGDCYIYGRNSRKPSKNVNETA